MSKYMRVQRIYTYTMKSTRGISRNSIKVVSKGLEDDRRVAIIDSSGKVVTGREYPHLLRLTAERKGFQLIVRSEERTDLSFPFPTKGDLITAKLFRHEITGHIFGREAIDWISDYLDGDYRLLYLGDGHSPVLSKRGGIDGEQKSYSDSSPVHLINLATLDYLNSKLRSKVGARNFRPNIIIEGAQPFEEDSWSRIEIGGCRFRVQERTNRCIFTTIDPNNLRKSRIMEPITTLAKIRIARKERPTFGIGIVPETMGSIMVGSAVSKLE